MNEIQLLRDAAITPTMDVLENITGKEFFSIYKKLHTTITGPEFELNPEWNYYNDGKAYPAFDDNSQRRASLGSEKNHSLQKNLEIAIKKRRSLKQKLLDN